MPKSTAMLAKDITGSPITEYLTNDDYVIEQKLDGHRVLLICDEGKLNVVNRNHQLSQHHHHMQSPSWLANLLPFEGRSIIFDAELIKNTAYIFDCLYAEDFVSANAKNLVDQNSSWLYRHSVLQAFFEAEDFFNERFQLVPTARTSKKKIALVRKCMEEHAEGIMIKDRHAPYVYGRSDHMLKYKFVKTADLVVRGVNVDEKNAAVLCAVDGETFVDVGRCSLEGKEPVHAGDVVEVRYLYFSDGGRLIQPVLLRKRDDKNPFECHIDQLQTTSKEVLSV